MEEVNGWFSVSTAIGWNENEAGRSDYYYDDYYTIIITQIFAGSQRRGMTKAAKIHI